jgi:phenylalanyl-tRNA synthetase beta chain
MLVPRDLGAGTIAAFISAHDEPLLQSFELFDLFEDADGVKLAKDHKSLAYSILYRSPDRTLEAHEVETAHSKLLDSLKSGLHVDFR